MADVKKAADDRAMVFQIKNRCLDTVIFETELPAEVAEMAYRFQLGFAVNKAIRDRILLRGADLRDAYLRNADLRGANLSGTDLSISDLRGADLRWVHNDQTR